MRRSTTLALVLVLLGLTLLAAAPTSGTPPSLPLTATGILEGEPAVGQEVLMRVRFDMRGSEHVIVRLHGSRLVEVLGPATVDVPGKGVTEGFWDLRVTGEGFWSLGLSATLPDGEPYSFQGPCCGFGWSGNGAGAWGSRPMEPFPELPDPAPQARTAVEVVDGKVRLSYEVSVAGWLSRHDLRPQVGEGSINAAQGQRAVSLDAVRWQADFDVPDGGEVLAYTSSAYWVTFPPARESPTAGNRTPFQHGFGDELHCRNLRLVREGDTARIEDDWACSSRAGLLHGVPSLPFSSLAAALAAAALLARRVKG